MDVNLVTKSAFAVIGIAGAGATPEGPRWIPPLWAEARQHRAELESLPAGPAWGLMSAPDRFLQRWTGTGRYLAGWEVRGPLVPFGRWSVWQVPDCTFLTVGCTLPTYGEAMAALARGFSAAAGHCEPAGAIHEYYPASCFDPATDRFFLCAMASCPSATAPFPHGHLP